MKNFISRKIVVIVLLVCTIIVSSMYMTACVDDNNGSGTSNGSYTNNGSTGNNTQTNYSDIKASADMDNAIIINYRDNGNMTVDVTVSVKGRVCFAGITALLKYDSNDLVYASNVRTMNNLLLNNTSQGLNFTYSNASNITEEVDLFTIRFNHSGTVETDISIEINDGDFSDSMLNNVQYRILGGHISVK